MSLIYDFEDEFHNKVTKEEFIEDMNSMETRNELLEAIYKNSSNEYANFNEIDKDKFLNLDLNEINKLGTIKFRKRTYKDFIYDDEIISSIWTKFKSNEDFETFKNKFIQNDSLIREGWNLLGGTVLCSEDDFKNKIRKPK